MSKWGSEAYVDIVECKGMQEWKKERIHMIRVVVAVGRDRQRERMDSGQTWWHLKSMFDDWFTRTTKVTTNDDPQEDEDLHLLPTLCVEHRSSQQDDDEDGKEEWNCRDENASVWNRSRRRMFQCFCCCWLIRNTDWIIWNPESGSSEESYHPLDGWTSIGNLMNALWVQKYQQTRISPFLSLKCD